jgi:hypothetical protein
MDRRHILGMLGAAPFAAATFSPRPAKAATNLLNPNNPDDLYTIYRKLNLSFDNRVVYWYIRAVRYGLVDSEFTPFWDMHVGFLSITEDEGDGHRTKNMSAIFYTDLKTGELLETFDNPYTGEKIPVRQPGLGRSSSLHTKQGRAVPPAERPGATLTSYSDIGPAWVIGDDVWCRGDTGFRAVPTTDEDSLLQINDWTTYHGSIAEVSDPDVISANATDTFNDINTWPAWLNMKDIPGNYVSRGFGRKSWSMDDMPPEWSAIMRDLYPKEFADPRAYVEGA